MGYADGKDTVYDNNEQLPHVPPPSSFAATLFKEESYNFKYWSPAHAPIPQPEAVMVSPGQA